jgi:hypothetical protein
LLATLRNDVVSITECCGFNMPSINLDLVMYVLTVLRCHKSLFPHRSLVSQIPVTSLFFGFYNSVSPHCSLVSQIPVFS